jgi:hypothetical protein
MREVVLGIETIPCEESVWQALPYGVKYDYLVQGWSDRDCWKNTALDPSLGRIVCIAFLFGDEKKPKSKAVCAADEAEVLRWFWAKAPPDSRLIGSHLNRWELDFIFHRSMRAVGFSPFQPNIYNTLNYPRLDVLEAWVNWKGPRYPRLELLAKIPGVRGKLGAEEQVRQWYREKSWKRIEDCCLQNVRLTYALYRQMKTHIVARERQVGKRGDKRTS